MTKVSQLKPKPNDKVVKLLEGFLERAKAGELRSIALVGLNPEGSVSAWHHDNELQALLGAVLVVQHRILSE